MEAFWFCNGAYYCNSYDNLCHIIGELCKIILLFFCFNKWHDSQSLHVSISLVNTKILSRTGRTNSANEDKIKKIVIGIWFFALLPCLCWAEELTGRDIALKMYAVDTSRDSKRTAIMVINRKGQKLVRKMESCNKKYGPDERGLIKFIEPLDVRGIMYLT